MDICNHKIYKFYIGNNINFKEDLYMKNIMKQAGSTIYTYYIQPIPKAVTKAIISHVISTTIALVIAGGIKAIAKMSQDKAA